MNLFVAADVRRPTAVSIPPIGAYSPLGQVAGFIETHLIPFP